MSEVNTNTENAATEESIQQSIEELGGIPIIELSMEVSGMTAYPTDKTLSVADMPADAKAVGDAIADNVADIGDLNTEVAAIQAWTGEDIPLNSSTGADTIAEAFSSIISESYPVGSIYMTISDEAPSFTGTWVEIGITATWNQLKNGKRGYTEFEEGETGGTVHFWLRTD